MFESYQQHCKALQSTGNYRQLPDPHARSTCLERDFSSNDYLGLSRHPAVIDAGILAVKHAGAGATGSRLLSGNAALFQALETRIAQDKGTQAALLFNSGFQANVTVLSSLLNAQVLKQKPLVFFDRLNHASLYQAVFLSGAELIRYHHLDYDHLATHLSYYRSSARPKFIVTESLFGMDGDVLALEKIVSLAHEHQAFLYLDEAHAVGILGPNGYGLSTTLMHDVPCLVMGTLSKAVGCSGAYVAGDSMVIEYLTNMAQGFIFSTAPSPFIAGAALKAWELIADCHDERKRLLELAEILRARLRQAGWNTGQSCSHIIPMIIGDCAKMQCIDAQLKASDLHVSLIRRPTVPPQGERLRIALNVHHTEASILQLVHAL